MTDSALREAEKRAATGGVEEQARVLVGRMRAGTLTRERLTLAAYCGHKAARAASGTLCPGDPSGGHTGFCDEDCGVFAPFAGWVSALSRWADIGPVPGWVERRAATAAGEAAICVWLARNDRGCPDARGGCGCASTAPRTALDDAAAWIAAPREHAEAAAHFSATGALGAGADFATAFLGGMGGQWQAAIADAARLIGEADVRSAIQTSLVSWALS